MAPQPVYNIYYNKYILKFSPGVGALRYIVSLPRVSSLPLILFYLLFKKIMKTAICFCKQYSNNFTLQILLNILQTIVFSKKIKC